MDLTEKREQENQKRFNELLNRYPAEPEESDSEIIDEFYNNIKYTDEEIEYTIGAVKEVVEYLRGISPIWRDLVSGKKEFIIK